MENNSKNSSSTSSNKPIKTLSHYVNKFFRHSKRSGNSSTSVVGSSDYLLQSTQSGVSVEKKRNCLTDISRAPIPMQYDAIKDRAAHNTPVLEETKSVDTDVVNNESEDNYEQILNQDDISLQPMSTENRYGRQHFAVEHLPKFCEKLHNLVEIVRNILADSNSLSDYPRELQSELVKEAKELDILYAEIRCIQTTIERVRNQRDIIRNAKIAALEQQTKLEEEEIKEIEKSIAITEKPLVKSWERIKRCRTPESFEKLLNEVHHNLEVLKNLEILIQNRKNKTYSFHKRPTNDSRLVNSILTAAPKRRILKYASRSERPDDFKKLKEGRIIERKK